MIVCDICKRNVADWSLEENKMVYGLLPVEVSLVHYNKAYWIDANDGSGMTQFLHDDCLRTLLQRKEHNDEEDRNFPEDKQHANDPE